MLIILRETNTIVPIQKRSTRIILLIVNVLNLTLTSLVLFSHLLSHLLRYKYYAVLAKKKIRIPFLLRK